MLISQRSVIGRHSLAEVRVLHLLDLVDQVPDSQRMILGGTEHQRFLALIDFIHEDLHSLLLSLLDLDHPVKVLLRVPFSRLDLPLDQLVVRRIYILVQRRFDLPKLKRR